jgi:hypothetical protein
MNCEKEVTRMSFLRGILFASCAALLLLSLLGCKDEGGAERLGKKIDRAAEKTGEKLDNLGDKLKRD